jgi:hypothetical protein
VVIKGGERKLVRTAFGRFKRYKNPGMQLYIPDRLCTDQAFPFQSGEVVKIRIEDNRVIEEKAEWWELLDWSKLPDAYKKLPSHIKELIDKANAPDE